jgi:hypothetical protein
MPPGRLPGHREDMDVHDSPAAFLVSGATLDDESVGPLYATAAEAHLIARTTIAGVGGTVRILRDSPDGWLEVARYTDTGRHAAAQGVAIDWAAVAFADEM